MEKLEKQKSSGGTLTRTLIEFLRDIPKLPLDRTPTAVAQEPEYLEALPRIAELYKNAELWHGTGRFRYKDGEVSDNLDGIVREGGLKLHRDELDPKTGPIDIISTAPSRMYARLYAGMNMPNSGRISNELGSRELWGNWFLVRLGIKAIREFSVSLGQLRRGDPDTLVPDGAKKMRQWKSKISTQELSTRDIFLKGTDIQANYPILIAVKRGGVQATADSAQSLRLDERRATAPIYFSDMSHIEVPKDRVEETASMLRDAGHADIPVLPIEYGEEYCRRFSFFTLKSGRPLDESKENAPIVPGNRYEDHQFSENSDDIRLMDGTPLWHALLENPETPVLKANDADAARDALRELFNIDPDGVRELAGSTIKKAREKLLPAVS